MKNNTLTIIKKEFARFFGDKRMVFTTILMPGLMVYIMYTLMGNIMTNQFTSADDFVASGYVQNMPEELEPMLSQLPVEWQDIEANQIADIQESLTAKEADLLLVFPENFIEAMSTYEVSSQTAAPNIEIYYNSAKPESGWCCTWIPPVILSAPSQRIRHGGAFCISSCAFWLRMCCEPAT